MYKSLNEFKFHYILITGPTSHIITVVAIKYVFELDIQEKDYQERLILDIHSRNVNCRGLSLLQHKGERSRTPSSTQGKSLVLREW